VGGILGAALVAAAVLVVVVKRQRDKRYSNVSALEKQTPEYPTSNSTSNTPTPAGYWEQNKLSPTQDLVYVHVMHVMMTR
jgi:hypothetical protein